MAYQPIPFVIEQTSRGVAQHDIYSRLLQDRIIFCGSPITDQVANVIIAQLLFLDADDPDRDVFIYLNSPGGSVSAGLAIFDTMQYLKSDVSTICMGMAASMGAFLLAAGTKGKRYALPNSRIMIHQPSGGAQGQAADMEIHAREILKTRDRLNQLLAESTGQTVKKIGKDSDRDYFMTAEEAVEYGLVDRVISKAESIRKSE